MSRELPRCGRISYTNDLPVYTAIDEGVVLFPGSMIADVPAELNRALFDGLLDCSPISSAFYAEHADAFALFPGVCIGANERVQSVCCISSLDPKALAGKTIYVTRESVTGRALFTLLCRARFGFDPKLAESDDPFDRYLADGSPCLLIGDKAIDAAEAVPPGNVHDLGELWHRWTGDGMVYAVWAVRNDFARREPEVVRALASALQASLDWGLENIDRVIRRAEAAHPRGAGFYADYYHSLNFRFDTPARKALQKFFTAAKDADVLSAAPPLRFVDEVLQRA